MNTNNTGNEGKERVLKTLAIGGFIGLIIIIAWLGIQLISFMPSAFSSLASLANSVYNYKPTELVVVSNKSVANAGEAFSITWNTPKQDGDFTFMYECAEGIAVEIRVPGGDIETVSCGEAYSIGNTDTLDISINSERNRFTDVTYTISFIPDTVNAASASDKKSITVVNAMISPVVVGEATSTPPVVDPKPEPKPETPVATTTTPKPTTPKPTPKPVVIKTPIYGIPVSNPNGFTDLAVRALGIGTIDSNNRFTALTFIDNDNKGAIQFEIKNFGTKTSDSFTYTVKLPNGSDYTSPVQSALKPNERMVATIGFDAVNVTGVKSYSVSVSISGDSNTANNQFSSAVSIVD